MFRLRTAVTLFCIMLAGLLGCSIHPLQEDVTRKSTFDIVKTLLCEARRGMIDANLTTDEINATLIGLDFDFNITENNKATEAKLEFLHPFLNGNRFSLDLSGGVDKKRESRRHFRVVEPLAGLLDARFGSCDQALDRSSFVYPISGKVGLDEVVRTYFGLQRLTTVGTRGGRNVFSDEIIYTTTLVSGIRPTLELNAVAGRFKLTKASINGSADRTDEHKVAIVIAPSTTRRKVVSQRGFAPYDHRKVGPSIGIGGPATSVIQELDRLRERADDLRTLERLRFAN